jgi:hypothetical protein
MICRIFSGSYSRHDRRMTFGFAGILMDPSLAANYGCAAGGVAGAAG